MRSLVVLALVPFLASRAVLIAVVLIVEALPIPWDRPSFDTRPLLGGLTGHDAIYYLGIAAEGYHLEPVSGAYPDWVFFPAFPLITRLMSVVTLGDVAVAGILVSNLALLIGLVLVATLVHANGDSPAARPTTWLVAFAPGAVAFGMAYSDSLLLAASAGAILATRRRTWWLVAVLLAVATLSRPPGILLCIPLLVAIWQTDGRATRHLLVLAAGPIALAVFAAYQGAVLGDPLAFIHGQAAWNIAPITDATAGGAPDDGSGWYIGPMVGLLIVILLAYTAMLPGLWRSRIPRPEVLVGFVAFASVFLSGRLQSDARYLAAGWPFSWFLALSRRWVLAAALVISVAGYVVLAFLNVSQLLAP
jgi:hypothetical protein